jgi:hypothetical protein
MNQINTNLCENNKSFKWKEISDKDFIDLLEKEKWPKEEFGKLISNQDHDFNQENSYREPFSDKWFDCTRASSGIFLAQKYLPDVQVLGPDLEGEKNSSTWGGMTYRVLADKKNITDSNRAIIQYIFIWSKQRLPFTLWNSILPLIILLLLSVYTSMDLIYQDTIFPNLLPKESLIDANTRQGIILFLCLWYIMLGGYYIFYKLLWQGILSVRSIFFAYGVGFLSLQWFYKFETLEPCSIQTPIFLLNLTEIRINLDYPTIIFSGICVLFFLLIVLFQYLDLDFILKNKYVKKIVGTHKMDYAPIVVYLSKLDGKDLIENACVEFLYDRTHYCIEREFGSPSNGTFVIKGRWHSLEYYKQKDWENSENLRNIVKWAFVFFTIGLILAFLLNLDLMWIILSILYIPSGYDVLFHRLIYPALLFYSGYFVITNKTTSLHDEKISENLIHEEFHLSPLKLLKMWNLKEEAAQFTIKHKLQNPLEYIDAHNSLVWVSFYDDTIEVEKDVPFLCNIGYSPRGWLALIRNLFDRKQKAGKLSSSVEQLWRAKRKDEAMKIYDQAVQFDRNTIEKMTMQAKRYEDQDDLLSAQNLFHIQTHWFERKDDRIKLKEMKKKANKLGVKLKKKDSLSRKK